MHQRCFDNVLDTSHVVDISELQHSARLQVSITGTQLVILNNPHASSMLFLLMYLLAKTFASRPLPTDDNRQ